MVPGDGLFRPITPDFHALDSLMVADLIDHSTHCWDINFLCGIFWDEDVDAITQIPLVSPCSVDVRVWHYTRHGFYSVKSAYYLARNSRRTVVADVHGSRSNSERRKWDFIWSIKLPTKIRIFLWRMLRQALHCLFVYFAPKAYNYLFYVPCLRLCI